MTNQALQERKARVFARGQGNVYPIYVDKALNAVVSLIFQARGNLTLCRSGIIQYSQGVTILGQNRWR